MVWGLAFVVQKSAMETMGPLTFIAARYLLGGIAVLPLVLVERRREAARPPLTRGQWLLVLVMSLVFFVASWLQQAGLVTTTVTNGGFLTGLYVLFVPLILFAVFRARPHPVIWIAMPLALGGLYLLNGGTLDNFAVGDAYVAFSAVFWALHVLLLGALVQRTARPILVSAVSFLVAGGVAAFGAAVSETVTVGILTDRWLEIAYAGLLSTALAFTLQAIGQQHVPPANAAIVLSAESLFAALGGAVLLGERLIPIGYLGAGLIFCAIVLVEVLPAMRQRSAARRG